MYIGFPPVAGAERRIGLVEVAMAVLL